MKKTILVTGGAGYIGSHTAYTMAQLGHKIIILDDLIYNQPFNHRWATLIKNDYGDVQALRDIFSLHQIDAVMHFASFIEVGRSTKAPLDFYHNNVSKTITLLQVMLEYNVKKIIFSSSCAVYGVPDSVPLAESCAKNPLSPYGKTKLMIEHILADAAAAHGLQFVGLRYFNAAGVIPNTDLYEFHEPETHLIPLLIKAARNNLPFYIFGNQWPTPDGTCIRDFLHVADIANAHAQALNYLDENKPNDFFNLGTGTGFSV